MPEPRTQASKGHKKDLQDAVALGVYNTLSQAAGDFYIQVGGDDKCLCFGHEPGTDGMLSNQFECLVDGDTGDIEQDDYEEYCDVLVVTVEYKRRRLA